MNGAKQKWIDEELMKVIGAKYLDEVSRCEERISSAAYDAGVKHALEHVASVYRTKQTDQAKDMRGTMDVLTSWGFLEQEVRRMKP